MKFFGIFTPFHGAQNTFVPSYLLSNRTFVPGRLLSNCALVPRLLTDMRLSHLLDGLFRVLGAFAIAWLASF